MSDRTFYLFADGPAPVAPYSHAVSAGDWIFVTGQLPTGAEGDPIPESIEDQTHKVMANLRDVLDGCGATLGDVVSVRIFLTRFEAEYDAMNAVYETYFPADRRPARTTVGVTALARGCRVEIDLIAKRTIWSDR
jgi:2-iminobutanoate/2-iminopropanoate deaminase